VCGQARQTSSGSVIGPVWRVVVVGKIDDQASAALEQAGATYISGHSGPGRTSSSFLVRAEDEAAARKTVADALPDTAFVQEARAMPVYVQAPISEQGRSAFEAAGRDPRVGGVVEDETTGELEVYFELAPGDVDRAFNEARGLYKRIADAAGIPVPDPLEMTMSGFDALLDQSSHARQRLGEAQRLFDRGDDALAVVVAQTACEVLINDVLVSLVQPHVTDEVWPWVAGRVRSFTLIDDQTKDLWRRVAGSSIQDQPFWPEYRRHVTRRNAVLHRGESVSTSDAQKSLDVAEALIGYVEKALGAAPPPG
jgi:HEPN domain-containing protein